MVMNELETQEARQPPPPPPPPRVPASFSSPFSTPTLQWARRKRLRCSNSPHDPSRRLLDYPPDQSPPTPLKEKDEEEEKLVPTNKPIDTCEGGMFLRSRAMAGDGENARRRKKKKVELWISLSREEIEEDYYSITGCKLPRRPKRRPRNSPANLPLRIFPGSWLPNTVTPEMYKVHEPPEPRRR